MPLPWKRGLKDANHTTNLSLFGKYAHMRGAYVSSISPQRPKSREFNPEDMISEAKAQD